MVVVAAEDDVRAAGQQPAIRRAPVGEPHPARVSATEHVVVEGQDADGTGLGLGEDPVTRVVSDAGRCPFTATSRRFQVNEPSATP